MQSITIQRSGSQPSSQGQAEYFTGSVRVDPPLPVVEPSRIAGARVTFEPVLGRLGTPPSGRYSSLLQGPAGCSSGTVHWHGATATTRMTHIALQEQLEGNVVEWMEKVSNEQYRRP